VTVGAPAATAVVAVGGPVDGVVVGGGLVVVAAEGGVVVEGLVVADNVGGVATTAVDGAAAGKVVDRATVVGEEVAVVAGTKVGAGDDVCDRLTTRNTITMVISTTTRATRAISHRLVPGIRGGGPSGEGSGGGSGWADIASVGGPTQGVSFPSGSVGSSSGKPFGIAQIAVPLDPSCVNATPAPYPAGRERLGLFGAAAPRPERCA
jgi:hypothetical protein